MGALWFGIFEFLTELCNMKHIKFIFTFLLISLVSGYTYGQNAEASQPIKWRMSVKMTSPKSGTVTLRAIIDPGWHLYGMTLPKNGPVPTTFDFSASRGIEFTENSFTPARPTQQKDDPNFGIKIGAWEKEITFTRHFVLTGKIEDALVSGTVRFMGCNDKNCLPPKTQTFKTSPKPFNPTK